MEYTYPDYYKKFACIGGACEDNCCKAGWQICIDDESLEMYQKLEGPLGVRIRNSIDWKNGMYEQLHGQCALLNEEGLCDVCIDGGVDMMCKLCQKYPRHFEEYENLREVSLSMSCPEAARIILSNRDKVSFYTEEDDEEEEYEDFDYFMFTKLQEIREYLLKLAQDDSIPIDFRIATCYTTIHDMQNRIDKDEIFELDTLLDKYNEEDFVRKAAKKYRAYQEHFVEKHMYMADMMSKLHKLEVLKPSWTEFVKKCEKTLYLDSSADEYMKISREFDMAYPDIVKEQENMLVYFIYTYFCGAVYDYDIQAKVKLGIYSVMMIHEMDKAEWYNQGKKFSFADQVRIAHTFSKEIEHSDPNLNDIEKMMNKDKAFGLKKMLTCILS